MESILKTFNNVFWPSREITPEEKVNNGLNFARKCSQDRGSIRQYNRLESIINQKIPIERDVLVDVTNDVSPGLGHVDCMHEMFENYTK